MSCRKAGTIDSLTQKREDDLFPLLYICFSADPAGRFETLQGRMYAGVSALEVFVSLLFNACLI